MSTVATRQAEQKRPPGAATTAAPKCRLCKSRLDPDENDDLQRQVCHSCSLQPEGRRILAFPKTAASSKHDAARDFTPADKGLIAKLSGFMPTEQLLTVLNERLLADLGPDASPYTMQQLFEEIEKAGTPTPKDGHDWASLRKLLATARRKGVLDRIDEQRIDDFAVIFSLTPAQVLRLKDVLLSTEEDV